MEEEKMTKRLVLIGCGPTTMGALYHLEHLIKKGTILRHQVQVTVLEKESEPGGLARSVTDDAGFSWDLGVHITNGSTRFPEFLVAIGSAVEEWNEIRRCVKADMKHVIGEENPVLNHVPYPVQHSIPYFPANVRDQCLSDLESTTSRFEAKTPKNFAEYTEKCFGKTLQEIFIRPYNEKVWTVRLDEMSCRWVEGRVPTMDLDQIRRQIGRSREELVEEEMNKPTQWFRYPAREKGVGAVWTNLIRRFSLMDLHFNTTVVSIDPNRKEIRTVTTDEHTNAGQEQSFSYDYLLSTMPIVQLGHISGLAPDIQLCHSKVVLVGIGLRKPQTSWTESLSWVYFPNPDCIFYRCTFISNFSDVVTPDVKTFWSLLCEIGLAPDAPIDQDDILKRVIHGLQYHCVIGEEQEDIVQQWFHVLPYGYPIPTLNRESELCRVQNLLQSNDIYSRGRFGGWKYEIGNQDHSFRQGREVIDRILFDKTEQLYTTDIVNE